MNCGVLKTTCRDYVFREVMAATKKAMSSETEKEIQTQTIINAIISYIDLYFPVQNEVEGANTLRGRPRNVVHQLILEHKQMKEALEFYRGKDILSLAEAKRGIDGEPWSDAPSLADWSVAHRCLQELENKE